MISMNFSFFTERRMVFAMLFNLGCRQGLKARNVIAWGEAPCAQPQEKSPNTNFRSPVRAEHPFRPFRPQRMIGYITWACARDARYNPGYHIAGFQPCQALVQSNGLIFH
jgi:hypothetical protein